MSARSSPVFLGSLLGFFEAVGLAVDGDHLGAMNEPIDERDDARSVWEYLFPFPKGLVGRDDRALPFVAPVEQLEEQVGMTIGIRKIADFVDE